MIGNIINNVPIDSNKKLDFNASQISSKKITVKSNIGSNINKIISNKECSISNNGDCYSNTSLSSRSNIFINKIANDISNVLKNKLNNEEFGFYQNYLVGKKVKDIIYSNGQFRLLVSDYNSELVKSINKKLTILNDKTYQISLDRKILNSSFNQIVSKESGFDAIVLENDDEYWIISACCDSESKQDVMVISYALLYQITGSDEIWYSLASLLVNDKGKIGQFNVKELANASKYYENQRDDNMELISRYVNKGKKLRLGGYSLGGGIMLAAYARLYFNNPVKYQDTTVTVFNPFMSYLEIDSKKYLKDQQDSYLIKGLYTKLDNMLGPVTFLQEPHNLIEAVRNADDNVLIYSGEGDTVSQFNTFTKVLDKQIVYLKGKNDIENNLHDITDIINLIVGEDSRHGFKGLDLSAFDKNGNLLDEGNQLTVNEIAGGQSSTNNLSKIMETIISLHIEKEIGIYIDELPKEQEWMREDIINMYFDFRHYLIANAGHYDSKSMIHSIIPSLTSLLKKGALKKDDMAIISNIFINDKEIEMTLSQYYETIDGKRQLQDILDYCMLGSIDKGMNKLQKFLTNIYYQTHIMKTVNGIQKNFEQGYNLGIEIHKKDHNNVNKFKEKKL